PNWTPAAKLRRGPPARIQTVCAQFPNPPGLSPPYKTRQTRQIGLKLLIPEVRVLSGRPKNPTNHPTNLARKPDKSRCSSRGSCEFSGFPEFPLDAPDSLNLGRTASRVEG